MMNALASTEILGIPSLERITNLKDYQNHMKEIDKRMDAIAKEQIANGTDIFWQKSLRWVLIIIFVTCSRLI